MKQVVFDICDIWDQKERASFYKLDFGQMYFTTGKLRTNIATTTFPANTVRSEDVTGSFCQYIVLGNDFFLLLISSNVIVTSLNNIVNESHGECCSDIVYWSSDNVYTGHFINGHFHAELKSVILTGRML